MAQHVAQIQEIGQTVERLAGEEIAQQVMAGSEAIKASTKPPKVAAWVKGAMERLDTLTAEPVRAQIMIECGYNCAIANGGVIQRAQARRRKFATNEAFLEAEQQNPPAGTRLVLDGNTLYQYYMPRAFRHPMRCYCSLLRGLPDDQTTSLTYCYCSQGFVQKYWEGVLEQPVSVEIVESAVSGADECKFVIHLPTD